MWKFVNKAATETEPESFELRIDGEIIDDDDTWLYELFEITATSPNVFREELNKYEGKTLNIWIDSYGGSVFAATGIYTALMERKGANDIKIIKAMSAATIPAMAGRSGISPAGMFMTHDPLVGLEGYFNSSDLKKFINMLDGVKETIIDAYQTKTNMSRNKIREMMTEETYMSAKTAVEKGFVDEVLYSEKQEPIDMNFARRSIMNNSTDAVKRLVAMQKSKEPPKDEKQLAIAKMNLELII
jgi:ATP-dependent Clp protease protease subunit